MKPEVVGIIGSLILLLLIFLRMPIGLAMGLVGFAGFSYLAGVEPALAVLATSPVVTTKSYTMAVIPLFILMGLLAASSGVIGRTYQAASKWLGHLPGGLAMGTTAGCAIFGAVCGTGVAEVATMGKIAWPEMRKQGYDPKLATGCIASAGDLANLIPPSNVFIIYGLLFEVSIGRLFMAGVFPGLLLTAVYMLQIYAQVKHNPSLGPPTARASWGDRLSATKNMWEIAILILLVLGGIYSGLFTPTEAAGVGALASFILLLTNGKHVKQSLVEAFTATVTTTGMIFLILIGAFVFNYFMAVSKLPFALAGFISSLDLPPMGVLLVILVLFFFLGCVMSTLEMTVLVLPIIFPTITAVGFDAVWFGVIYCLMVEMAIITPPIGISVFVMAGAAPDVPMQDIFRGILPFTVSIAIVVALLVAFPQIALWLPNTMKG